MIQNKEKRGKTNNGKSTIPNKFGNACHIHLSPRAYNYNMARDGLTRRPSACTPFRGRSCAPPRTFIIAYPINHVNENNFEKEARTWCFQTPHGFPNNQATTNYRRGRIFPARFRLFRILAGILFCGPQHRFFALRACADKL